MKKTTILIVLCLLLSLTGCKKDDEVIDESVNKIDSDLIEEYKHYDDSKFYELCKEIELLIEKSDIDALSIYDELFEETKLVYDYSNIAMVNYDIDYTDEYWANEYEYTNKIYNGLRNEFLTIAHDLTASDIASEFEEHVNNNTLYEYYEDYITLSDDMIKLQNKEKELESDYMGLDYEADDYYDQAGTIFMQLVDVRAKLAEGFGYDNYIEYTDYNLYGRDYNPEELEPFYQAVKDMDYETVYSLKPLIRENAVEYDVDGAQSLIDLKETIKGISCYVDEAYDYLKKNNLYWYDNSELNNPVGYTFAFMSNYTPYIFNNLVGDPADLYYQVHELGHFANYYYCPNEVLIFNDGNYDLLEIHSQALELLSIDNVNNILDINNNIYKYNELVWSLGAIIEGCAYDEWQRIVYSNPDMSLEEIDALYNEIAYEYGYNENKEDISYEWKDVVHNFTDPGYYISYATSMFASIQLYNTYLEDKDLAIKQYNEILLMDGTSVGYKYAIENANMVMFSDYEGTSKILKNISEEIINNVK